MKATEHQLRTMIRKQLLGEAWNDDLTNMFADFLDFLQDAYNEKAEAASKATSARKAPPPPDDVQNAYAKMFDIKEEEWKGKWEEWSSPKDEQSHYLTAVVIGMTEATDASVLGEAMKALNAVPDHMKGMQDEDAEKAKEASGAANKALGEAVGTCSGWAKTMSEYGEIGKHWGEFVKAADKGLDAEGMASSAEVLAQFNAGCDKTVEIAKKALDGFDPDSVDHEKSATIVEHKKKALAGLENLVKAGNAISGAAEKLVGPLKELDEMAKDAPEEGAGGGPTEVTQGTKAEADGVLISAEQAKEFGIETQQEALMRNFLKEVL